MERRRQGYHALPQQGLRFMHAHGQGRAHWLIQPLWGAVAVLLVQRVARLVDGACAVGCRVRVRVMHVRSQRQSRTHPFAYPHTECTGAQSNIRPTNRHTKKHNQLESAHAPVSPSVRSCALKRVVIRTSVGCAPPVGWGTETRAAGREDGGGETRQRQHIGDREC